MEFGGHMSDETILCLILLSAMAAYYVAVMIWV